MNSKDEQFKEPFVTSTCDKDIVFTVERNSSVHSQEKSLSNKVGDSGVNKSQEDECKPLPVKKKHRRGSRRSRKKFKPYSKLTWEEKKAVEERESRRAVKNREKYMQEKGRPLAPYNTSQFLMAEHDTQEPNLCVHKTTRISSSADDSGDSLSYSDEERDIEDVRSFLQKDFTETYDRFHSETLHGMSKDELINEYIELENKVENLEKELNTIKSNGKVNGHDNSKINSEMNNVETGKDVDTESLKEEIQHLRDENQRLSVENIRLRPAAMDTPVS
ncbi:protein HEXIM1-like [Xenia sp. Carnegie-2017]|uniref:protein HEXIM1-like n=1 Tax=Xenia sp. Carnegie-2017 TaxID=2897299 RepID=UPI001F03941D|nr:protein HEXIM1-like [Xenia sp. Carnegie-2017]